MGSFLRFHLERWLQRGPFHQLAFVAALIALIAVVGGAIAWQFSGQFDSPQDGVWWSFLRLTDPGYLGDDEGLLLRSLSVLLIVLGMILFMGSLIAILTQWLRDTLARYEEGRTDIAMSGHIVIFGGATRTPEIIRQLLSSRGRLQRFLEEHGKKKLRIVVVLDEVTTAMRMRLARYLSTHGRRGQIYLRAGSATRMVDLARFDLGRAAAVIVPGDEFATGGTGTSDAMVIKSLLNLRVHLRELAVTEAPGVVAEVIDPALKDAATYAYGGEIEVIPGDSVIAQLLARSAVDHRLFCVFRALLDRSAGVSLFVREASAFAGVHPLDLVDDDGDALVLGAVRVVDGRRQALLNPPAGFQLEASDEIIYLARQFSDFTPGPVRDDQRATGSADASRASVSRKLLILGWSAHVGRVIADIQRSGVERLSLAIVSRTPIEERADWLKGQGLSVDRIEVVHHEAELLAGGSLDAIDLAESDSILIAASRSGDSAEERDARALTAYEMIKVVRNRQCAAGAPRPKVLLELAYPASADYQVEVGDQLILRPKLLGYLESQVALKPSLNAVFEALLLPTGAASVALRTGDDSGQSFGELITACAAPGDLPLGVVLSHDTADERIVFCPTEEERWTEPAHLIVLTGQGYREA